MPTVFISYSRRDSEFAERLERALSAREKEVWLDVDDIAPGAKWREEIHLGLAGCDGIVFVISPDSLASAECAKELEQAFELGKRVVPVLRREPDGRPVPEQVSEINYVHLRPEDDFEQGVESLIEALDKDFEWVHEHTRLGVRAAEWAAHSGRNQRAYLLRGADLRRAEALLTSAAGKEPAPTAEQLAFVSASRAGERRRNGFVLGSVSVALVVAVVLTIVALIERSSAIASQKKAYARQLSAESASELGIDPELSVLLASKGYDISPTAQSQSALRQALVASQIRMAVRPPDGVSEAAMTPDGHVLVTVGRDDGLVKLWRYPTGASLGTLPGVVAVRDEMSVNPVDGHVLVVDRRGGQAVVFDGRTETMHFGNGVTAASWSPDGRYLITGGGDGRVSIWNATSGARVVSAEQTGRPITQVAMSAHDAYAAAATRGGPILLYDLRTSTYHSVPFECPGGPGRILISPDETRLFAYGRTCTAELVATSTGEQVGHLGIQAAGGAFSPDGSYLVIAGETALIVDAHTGASATAHQYIGNDGIVTGAAFLAGRDGGVVATAGATGPIQIWDIAQPSSTLASLRSNMSGVGSVSPAADGRELVSVDKDGSAARVWASPIPNPIAAIGGLMGNAPALSPDGTVAVAQDADGSLGVFDPRTGHERRRLTGSRDGTSGAQGTAGAGLADGRDFAYAFGPRTVEVWRTGDGQELPAVDLSGDVVRAVAAAARAPLIAAALAAPGTSAGKVITFDPVTRRSAVVSSAVADALSVSENGSELAFASGRKVTLVDLRTGSRTSLSLGGTEAPRLLAFSGDGTRLAVGGRDVIDVFSVAGGGRLDHPLTVARTELASLALNEDGSAVAGGYSDRSARVWAVPADQLIHTVTGPNQLDASDAVTTVAFSRDGRFLLTSISYGDTELWDLTTGGMLYDIPSAVANSDQEAPAAWSDDGRLLLTGENGVQSWACDVCLGPAALRALARSRVTRGLTPGERATLLER